MALFITIKNWVRETREWERVRESERSNSTIVLSLIHQIQHVASILLLLLRSLQANIVLPKLSIKKLLPIILHTIFRNQSHQHGLFIPFTSFATLRYYYKQLHHWFYKKDLIINRLSMIEVRQHKCIRTYVRNIQNCNI